MNRHILYFCLGSATPQKQRAHPASGFWLLNFILQRKEPTYCREKTDSRAGMEDVEKQPAVPTAKGFMVYQE